MLSVSNNAFEVLDSLITKSISSTPVKRAVHTTGDLPCNHVHLIACEDVTCPLKPHGTSANLKRASAIFRS